jgi:hypothetical protein
MDQAVTDYIAKLNQNWQADVCTRIRQIVHQSVPDVQERIQYGKPHYLKNGKYAGVLGPAKDWVSFTLFNAGALEAPEGFFEPSDTAERKTVKIRQGQAVDYDLLAALVQQAASPL